MLAALSRAFGQLPDPRFRAVVLRGVLWCAALFALLVGGAWYAISATRLFGFGWLEWLADALGWTASIAVAIILFPGAVLTVLTFMLEDIARAVEARHYPDLPPARKPPLIETVFAGLRLAGKVILLNLLVSPLYLLFIIFPPINLFVFYLLNGYLLGREYFELIAFRRLETAAVRDLWRRNRGRLCLAGVIIAVLLSIPLINWVMPVVVAAFMLHLFEALRDRDELIEPQGTGSPPLARPGAETRR